ncbi:MAG: hypothetical protein JWQ27_2977 [Ferruginibacter sp.]|nr:hypothetical protein [Ferruginibacter sp.]
MNTNTKQANHIQDVVPDKKNAQLMMQTAWQLLIVTLFPKSAFNPDDVYLTKNLIRARMGEKGDPFLQYSKFCQCIMIAAHHKKQNPAFRLPEMAKDWVDPKNPRGIAASERTFERIEGKRKDYRLHLLTLRALPEALLELAEDKDPAICQYWSQWFLEREAGAEYIALQLVAAKIAFD